MDAEPIQLGWPQLADISDDICRRLRRDRLPDVVVGVLRGGMVPAVMICHQLGVRDLRAVDVRRTTSDDIGSGKTPQPIATRIGSLGGLAGADVLVVDDIAGSGATIRAVADLVAQRGAAKVSTAVCVVNRLNWTDMYDPVDVLGYVGIVVKGWVIFPWESK